MKTHSNFRGNVCLIYVHILFFQVAITIYIPDERDISLMLSPIYQISFSKRICVPFKRSSWLRMCYTPFSIRQMINTTFRLIKRCSYYCLTRVLTRRRLRNILKVLILYAVTLMCLFVLCQHLPFSTLYHSRGTKEVIQEKIQQINSLRIVQAQKVLSGLDAATRTTYFQNAQSGKLRYAIGVVTVARKVRRKDVGKLKYLTQVMAQLHRVLVKHGATNKVFPFICNVDSNPSDHEEAIQLAKYFPNVTKLNSPSYKISKENYRKIDIREREKQDYVFCLEAATQYKADYVILLEDDAYPNDDFYQVLEHLVKTKLETNIRRGDHTSNTETWGWVKLMISYSLTKYHKNWFFFYQWIALACFTSGLSCLMYEIYINCVQITNPSLHQNKAFTKLPSHISTICTAVFAFIFCLMIIFIIGRPYYVQIRTFSPYLYALEPGTSCCTPALLFQPAEVPEILSYLKKTTCGKNLPLDFALDNYRVKKKIKQYLVSPNIFSHIGFYSSLHQSFNTNEAEFI